MILYDIFLYDIFYGITGKKSSFWKRYFLNVHLFFLKGSSDAHFPQVDMILLGLNEKSITYFGKNVSMLV